MAFSGPGVPPLATNYSDFRQTVANVLINTPVRPLPDCSIEPLSSIGICDDSKSPYDRAVSLISELTLEEKINHTIFVMPGVERLGLPPFILWNEALHGVAISIGVNFSVDGGAYSSATSFPQPILTAAAFDDDLVFDVADAISTEARAFANAGHAGLDYWTPNVNPFKDPRWGRGPETPGEDAFRVAEYAKAFIRGMEGPLGNKYRKTVATCKHFAGNDLDNTHDGVTRYNFDAKIGLQDLAEYYLHPFEACTRDAKAGSVMCAYNSVNGIPQCADGWLMEDVVRKHWGWTEPDNYINGDCFALDVVFNSTDGHGFGATEIEAVEAILRAGTDTDCGVYFSTWLPGAVAAKPELEVLIDKALERVFASFVRLGYFDNAAAQPYRQIDASYINVPQSQDLARKAATSGMTLLKNDHNTLPLHTSTTRPITVALVGDWANATTQMLGGYSGIPPHIKSPLSAFQTVPGVTVNFVSSILDSEPVLAAANTSDITIYIGGIDQTVETEGSDRSTIAWNTTQLSLLSALADNPKPLIVVQTGGGQVDDSALLAHAGVSSILWAGYPGQEGGRAITDIIFGVVAPAGRLPVTQYPASYISLAPTDMNLRPDNASNPGRTYQWYTGTPVLPFGFGLHYTSFDVDAHLDLPDTALAGLSTHTLVDACKASGYTYLDTCPFAVLHTTVRNTGSTLSDYVALAFISGAYGPAPYPNKALVAYQRFHDVAPGTKNVHELKLTIGSLARWNEKGERVLYPSKYKIAIDVDKKCEVEFEVQGEEVVLETLPAMRT
ncbi:beta-glucosidase [Pseudovirgaria hyperparasitica]|uniref:xylan 1,4-beta-xylosidase n=1 Tax=Pseudovirgaria hyperparasitica TaxID=470096 RepID=A0A6A6W9V4_9PEZI|nr:beta-glucosidase [Pseudovirgaria hyperparasitica]KAF2759632.1 beta-glucosidase [Pseudovirgaria hyperparasitica]